MSVATRPPPHPWRWRRALGLALLILFHALPWLQWNGRQALLLDLNARRFDLFALTLWPDDIGVLLGLLAVMAVGLALLTHLAGRVWCGHACPQTLWTRAFDGIAQALARVLPAQAARPFTHVVWLLLSLWTGITFVGLFSPIRELVAGAFDGSWSGWETFWVLFYAGATWGNAGFLREQVCRSLCPFARMQPLLTDPHTPRMLYDPRRGEPRGARPPALGGVLGRGRGLLDPTTAQDYVFRAAHPLLAGPMPTFSADRLGDCIDCMACVRACPMQLDIRHGPQADCLACGACLEACTRQQQQAGFGPGLISYCSPQVMAGQPRRWWRPRTTVLASMLLALLACGVWRLF
ncbi:MULTISPECIES: 4Fe-4S dicluster domain-containing protein [Stenotrophomonas]|uniref:4Fe-4S binding protein n=1 Tax=Stenotrophomonas lactitubi TaxID=2045214 RepID=A0AAW4GJR8_9GAMM|nr:MULTISPECIES: 4Fe-4S dicluster domain-containing protein [Stenotrophomonas]MBM9914239.1 4Fe-4S binding protein [Stenotrophomonas lactitubi]MBM9920417.1 4Fe-4S binding protein [Stenotrophomonas lactitubi]MBM9939536.1 4Fe-4S binding protein [Stenotrophomonas lactitubi]NYU00777.1 4Fe-4S binding protein [Stenotrophomonas sp. SbOxS2]